MDTYSYIKAVSIDRLTEEIQDSPITVALDYIYALGSTVYTNFKADLSSDEQSWLEDIVESHVDEPLEENESTSVILEGATFTSEGGLKTAQEIGEMELMPVLKRRKHVSTASKVTFNDIEITSEVKLEGGDYYVYSDLVNIPTEDMVEFSIIDKNDIWQPGLFAVLGLEIGEDVLELHKFVKTEYIVEKKGEFYETAYGARAFEVMAGLFLRIAYTSTGSSDVILYSRILWDE